ncbi:cell wall metabolism sensor histidine kinase WalK, partial [bacterium]|nr:cell wall metabolism sensor histidine kinase WalK [bacterium]
MRISIRWKWMVSNVVIWSMVLLFMVVYLGARLTDYFDSRFEHRWRLELGLARDYLQTLDFESLTFESADRWADAVGEILQMRVTLIDLNGRVLGDSRVDFAKLTEVDDHSGRPEVVQALATGFGKSRRHSATIDRDLVYLAQPLGTLQNPRGIIRVAVPVSEIEDSLSQIHQLVWLSSGLALGLVVFIGFFVSKSMTQSLNEMVDFAKRITRGDFSGTIKPKENDELSDLGRALNKM